MVIEDDYDSEFRFSDRPLEPPQSLARDFAAYGLIRVPSAAGLHLAARLVPGATVQVAAVVRDARRHGVAVEDLSGYYAAEPAAGGLVLGYGHVPLARILEGLSRLAASFRRA